MICELHQVHGASISNLKASSLMISFTYESPWKFQWDLGGLHNPIGMDLERLTGSTQSVSQPSMGRYRLSKTIGFNGAYYTLFYGITSLHPSYCTKHLAHHLYPWPILNLCRPKRPRCRGKGEGLAPSISEGGLEGTICQSLQEIDARPLGC